VITEERIVEVDESAVSVSQLRTFKVWGENLEFARELVEKVNRKARRYGLSEYQLTVGEAQQEEVYRKTLFTEVDGTIAPTGTYRTFYMVELVGEMPQIKGWSFVATLDYSEEGGVITRPVPGVEVDLSGHRARAAECDYCHTKRERSATYVLRHEDGRTMQVGSACIKPYMGLTVSGLGWLAGDPFGELSDLGDDDDAGGRGRYGRVELRYGVTEVMEATMAVEQVKGWKSKAVAAEFGGLATSEWVRTVMDPRSAKDREQADDILAQVDVEKAKAKAALVLEWAKTQDGTSEWAQNLRVLASGETVNWRNMALLASAVAGYNRAQGEIRERAERVPSEWFGEVKKRQDFEGEVIVKRTYDGDYGLRTMLVMKTAKSEIAVWWTGWTALDEGDRVEGKVTVKGHETYKDEKRTVVTRCALEVVPAPE
jgi:hypothetical protein